MTEKLENKKSLESEKYITLNKALQKLGQAQYVSFFLNPNPLLHTDGTPYFDDIRTEGNPDDYHNLSIHKDDINKFIERWFIYKKQTSPFFANKTVKDFLPNLN